MQGYTLLDEIRSQPVCKKPLRIAISLYGLNEPGSNEAPYFLPYLSHTLSPFRLLQVILIFFVHFSLSRWKMAAYQVHILQGQVEDFERIWKSANKTAPQNIPPVSVSQSSYPYHCLHVLSG
ncbi:hypothetical protein ACJMK2_039767 [Sinanodonta woodiana]|uniref:Uncharacterized protein n=1 Tax=Sinanodonta woodiana TaxID=1069815 RepID=A0ABD3WD04_SINWO